MERYKAPLTGETVWARPTVISREGLFKGWLVLWELMGFAHIYFGVVVMQDSTFRRVFERY